ncbi:Transcription factor bHLH130, partial [Glycine soja]
MLGEPIATLRLLHYEGLMSSRPEIGNKSKTQNNAENEGFAESQGNEVIPAGLKRFRDEDVKPFSGLNAPESQNEIRGQQPSSSALAHQLSLPNTSTEMTAIEKFLQLSDFVPSKIRAKRGCATHPRSIAERSGGGLVEFAVAKKNILINVTLGGV